MMSVNLTNRQLVFLLQTLQEASVQEQAKQKVNQAWLTEIDQTIGALKCARNVVSARQLLVGNELDANGWDVVAVATAAHGGGSPKCGEFVVYNNNTDTYVIGMRENFDDMKPLIHGVFYYSDLDEDGIAKLYINACRQMLELAARF